MYLSLLDESHPREIGNIHCTAASSEEKALAAVPDSQHVEVPRAEIQLLVLCSCKAKTDSEHGENQRQKSSQNKKNCPQRKSVRKNVKNSFHKTMKQKLFYQKLDYY